MVTETFRVAYSKVFRPILIAALFLIVRDSFKASPCSKRCLCIPLEGKENNG